MQSLHRYADHTDLRLRLAAIRQDIDNIRHDIYWNDRLGASCDHLNKALEHVKAARDRSHDWEFRPHPILDAPRESTSSLTNASLSSSRAETSSISLTPQA